jgi:hypothetical protein
MFLWNIVVMVTSGQIKAPPGCSRPAILLIVYFPTLFSCRSWCGTRCLTWCPLGVSCTELCSTMLTARALDPAVSWQSGKTNVVNGSPIPYQRILGRGICGRSKSLYNLGCQTSSSCQTTPAAQRSYDVVSSRIRGRMAYLRP